MILLLNEYDFLLALYLRPQPTDGPGLGVRFLVVLKV